MITTGGQVVLSTNELRSRGATVDTVLCVVDRRPAGGRGPDKLAEAGLSLRALFTLDEIPERRQLGAQLGSGVALGRFDARCHDASAQWRCCSVGAT